MSSADNRQRAEFPPHHYWRRWGDDAPAAELPRADAADPLAATLPAGTSAGAATAAREEGVPYRVLIVEDDPSQALFAESVLNGAGMQAHVVMVSNEVMGAVDALRPDLVLTDLHMPGIDGEELTALIRSHPEHGHTPIVFLTGDEDPERRFEMLDVGADDFLRKPVRPRNLISAVQRHILRARAIAKPAAGAEDRHPVTGLHTRTQMLQLLSAEVPRSRDGGVFFVEIAGTAALRDRFGYAALETLLSDAGREIGRIAGAHAAARLNDNTFLVFAPALPGAELLSFSRHLRDEIGGLTFPAAGERIRLRAVIGHAALAFGFDDAGAALSAAEQALRDARNAAHGVAAWERPAAVEDRSADALAEALREALEARSLLMVFQPIVAVAGGDDAQYQVLPRLRDGSGELQAAGAVLQAAAKIHAVDDVDRHVFEMAVEAVRQRADGRRPVRLFITQSPISLTRDGHADWLLATLAGAGIDGDSLVIDIRQEDALVHALSLQSFCSAMVAAGVQLCLSQYAYGQEANALLSQLPLGYVRLAARYSNHLGDNAVRDEMRSAIEHAHRLGLKVIGQQVEDPQAAATLWMTGVDYIQGNLVQQPTGELDFDFQHSIL